MLEIYDLSPQKLDVCSPWFLRYAAHVMAGRTFEMYCTLSTTQKYLAKLVFERYMLHVVNGTYI